jgi:hypothetical protein
MVSYKYSYKTNDVFLIHILCKLATKRFQLYSCGVLRSAVTAILHIIIISDNIFVTVLAQKLKLALEGIAFDNEQKK